MDNELKWDEKTVMDFFDFAVAPGSRHEMIEFLKKFKENKQPKKDWEILSVCGEGRDCWSCNKTMFDWYLNNGWNINQVKRISDGEVFTVGDNTNKGKIESFIIITDENKDSKISASLCEDNYIGKIAVKLCEERLPNTLLNHLEKVEQPKALFTTEDLQPLYSGDSVWVLELPSYNLVRCIKLDDFKHKNQLYFKSQSAAIEYIINNKISLSFVDCTNVIEDIFTSTHDLSIENAIKIGNALKALIKQKTNL